MYKVFFQDRVVFLTENAPPGKATSGQLFAGFIQHGLGKIRAPQFAICTGEGQGESSRARAQVEYFHSRFRYRKLDNTLQHAGITCERELVIDDRGVIRLCPTIEIRGWKHYLIIVHPEIVLHFLFIDACRPLSIVRDLSSMVNLPSSTVPRLLLDTGALETGTLPPIVRHQPPVFICVHLW